MARKKHRGPVSGLALHHELYTVLRHKLDDGELKPGTVLPSEPHLAKQYAVSRTTVRRALARLAREKRVDRKHGSGTYVRDFKPTGLTTSEGPVPVDDLRAFGRLNASRLITHKIVNTPRHIRDSSSEFGDRCLLIQRTRIYENQPFMFLSHFIPEALAPLVSPRKLGNKPTIVAFDDAGRKPIFDEQLITCIAADRLMAQSLKVALGAPLLVIRRYVRDQNKKVLEFQEAVYRPDRYTVNTIVWRETVGGEPSGHYRAVS